MLGDTFNPYPSIPNCLKEVINHHNPYKWGLLRISHTCLKIFRFFPKLEGHWLCLTHPRCLASSQRRTLAGIGCCWWLEIALEPKHSLGVTKMAGLLFSDQVGTFTNLYRNFTGILKVCQMMDSSLACVFSWGNPKRIKTYQNHGLPYEERRLEKQTS